MQSSGPDPRLKQLWPRAKDEEGTRLIAEEALIEGREAPASAQVAAEQEHQARPEAETGLEEATGTMRIEAEDMESPPTSPGEEGVERRVTFILRLTVDQLGQPRRTEVEHAKSGRKATFPGLDVQRLTAFMKPFTGPQVEDWVEE